MRSCLLFLGLLFLTATGSLAQLRKTPNPPAPGFDAAGSDARAVQLADAVMAAVGGRPAWDNTHLITWTFQNTRKLVWDKWSGDVRVDNLLDDQTVLLNINNDQGRVFRQGEELTDADSVTKYVRLSKLAWINDSYWLLMPFKLKDPGVTLKYLGDDSTETKKPADVLQLTFRKANTVPNSKYKVWVDRKTRLISQWAYYARADDEAPHVILPWSDYQAYGSILLSAARGPQNDLTNVMVFTGLPGEVFSDFTRTDLSRYPQAK